MGRALGRPHHAAQWADRSGRARAVPDPADDPLHPLLRLPGADPGDDVGRLPDPGRDGDARLRAARARPERLGRVRRPARPRLHRLLRHRGVRLRDARVLEVRRPLAGLGGDPDRGRRCGRDRLPPRAAVPPPVRRLPGDRDVVLRADLLHARGPGLQGVAPRASTRTSGCTAPTGTSPAARTGSPTSTASGSGARRRSPTTPTTTSPSSRSSSSSRRSTSPTTRARAARGARSTTTASPRR